MRRGWWLGLVGSLSCVTAVAPPAPPAPPPAPVIAVPDGCLALQGGAWVHATDPSFRYLGDDDGGTLSLAVERLFVADAGFVPRRFRVDAGTGDATRVDAGRPRADAGAPDAGSPVLDGGARVDGGAPAPAADGGPTGDGDPDAGVTPTIFVTLVRTPGGFVGEVRSTTRHPSGQVCEVRFPTKVLACGDGGLTLETDATAALGDACQPPAQPQGLTREVHRLVRPRAP